MRSDYFLNTSRHRINKRTPPRKSGGIPYISTRLSLGVENEQADAGRD